nr:MAG TPA: hypothetical protein [Caudoviricetes sp.]
MFPSTFFFQLFHVYPFPVNFLNIWTPNIQ